MDKYPLKKICLTTVLFGLLCSCGASDNGPTKFNFKFDLNYSSSTPVTVEVEEGNKVERIDDPVREGFYFDDWYSDTNLTTLFDFETKIRKDTTVYAKWTEKFEGTITTEQVDREFETHTEAQLSYLNSSEYKTLPSGVSGSSEKSRPNSLDFTWTIDSSDTFDSTFIELSETEDMSNPLIYVGTTVPAEGSTVSYKTTITNFKVGTGYYYRAVAKSGNKVNRSDVKSFATKDGACRFISIDGVNNIRDEGAWVTEDGKKINQGLLYRGSSFNGQDSRNITKNPPVDQLITEAGIKTVTEELKIKTEIDLRGYTTFDWKDNINPSPTEISGLSDGHGVIESVKYILCPVNTSRDMMYKGYYAEASVSLFFSTLADRENYPIYYHCQNGKDRTGFIAYTLGAFLGMSKDDLYRDYLLSNFSNQGSVSASKIEGGNYDYVDYFEGIEIPADSKDSSKGNIKLEGETRSERAANFLLLMGVTQEQLDNIKSIFLD